MITSFPNNFQGTISGVSQYIKGSDKFNCKPLNPTLKVIAVEPMEQMLITDALGGKKIGPQGPHKIQGMGAGLVPKVSECFLIKWNIWVYHSNITIFSLTALTGSRFGYS